MYRIKRGQTYIKMHLQQEQRHHLMEPHVHESMCIRFHNKVLLPETGIQQNCTIKAASTTSKVKRSTHA